MMRQRQSQSCRLNVENIAIFANRVGVWMRQEGSDKCFEVARCLTHLSKAVDRHVHASGAQVTDSGRAKTERLATWGFAYSA